MIKVTKHLYIHPLTIMLFAACYIMRRPEFVLLCYAIIAVHESAHLAAALCIGLMPSKIVIYPFGLNLKLKNKIVYSLSDEIILYAAGPLSNIVMALAALPFINKIPYAYEFYMQNMGLFVINMLPVMPLDGGVIAKKLLSQFCGRKKAGIIMKITSAAIISAIAVIGVYLAAIGSFSVCLFVIFLVCNIFSTEEKYNIDFVKELIYYKEKKTKKVKAVLMGDSLRDTAEMFSPGAFYIVCDIDSDGKISDVLTETEVLDSLVKSRAENITSG